MPVSLPFMQYTSFLPMLLCLFGVYTAGMKLTEQKCVACEGDVTPLEEKEVSRLLRELSGWKLEKGGVIRKDYAFSSFPEAIAFVNKVADLAEAEGHHPDITIWYKAVRLTLTTHAIGGLSMNDVILAAKLDAIV